MSSSVPAGAGEMPSAHDAPCTKAHASPLLRAVGKTVHGEADGAAGAEEIHHLGQLVELHRA